MFIFSCILQTASCLPSHEGSGLKFAQKKNVHLSDGLPSHEGSGLKFGQERGLDLLHLSPLA